MARTKDTAADEQRIRQFRIIEAVGSKTYIDPVREIRIRVNFLKDFLKSSGMQGYVLGISGGIDSALAGKLAQIAVEELRNEGYDATFVGMKLPYGVQADADDVQVALDFINPDEIITLNIKDTVDAMVASFATNGVTITDYHKGNIKARARMVAQYAIAGERKLLVAGSENANEYLTGFYTKFGDSGFDISAVSGLTKRQERRLMVELGSPESIINKTPTADLLDNKPQQADENELGLDYETLSDYLEGESVSPEIAEKIEARYLITEHKRQPAVVPWHTWWK